MSNTQKQEVTVKDVLEATIRELKNVSIPAYLAQDEMLVRSISFPINRSINNLNLLIQVLETAKNNDNPEDVIELFAEDKEADEETSETEEGGSENEEKDQLEGTV